MNDAAREGACWNVATAEVDRYPGDAPGRYRQDAPERYAAGHGGGDAEDLIEPPTDPARMRPSQRPPAPGKNLTSNISDQ